MPHIFGESRLYVQRHQSMPTSPEHDSIEGSRSRHEERQSLKAGRDAISIRLAFFAEAASRHSPKQTRARDSYELQRPTSTPATKSPGEEKKQELAEEDGIKQAGTEKTV